jgi:hypothetical protein
MKKIYISGPMTGIKDYNYPEFDRVSKFFKDNGHAVVNPADVGRSLNLPDSMSDEDKHKACMKADIEDLLDCSHIHLLTGWCGSKGARIELSVAESCGIEVVNIVEGVICDSN